MTTDATALQERIARVLHEIDPISGHGHDWRKLSDAERKFYIRKAAAVLPIIAAEVQAAKAEALREMAEYAAQDLGWATGGHTSTHRVRFWLRARADEHETGARA